MVIWSFFLVEIFGVYKLSLCITDVHIAAVGKCIRLDCLMTWGGQCLACICCTFLVTGVAVQRSKKADGSPPGAVYCKVKEGHIKSVDAR